MGSRNLDLDTIRLAAACPFRRLIDDDETEVEDVDGDGDGVVAVAVSIDFVNSFNAKRMTVVVMKQVAV